MGSIIEDAKKIIDDNAKLFCDKINFFSEIGPYKRKSSVSFEIFHPGNDEYYEYKKIERTLEWYIRDWYVNKTIDELFDLHGKNVWWPNTEGKQYVWHSNEAIEDVLFFEFIADVNEKSVLYRYTDLCLEDEEFDRFLHDFEVDHVEVIDWDEPKENSKPKTSWGVSEEKRDKVLQISLQEFFIEHFSKEEYDYFVKRGKEAVKEANEDIGFQTIPKLSLRNLSSFKHDILRELSEIDYSKLKYEVIDTVHKNNDNRTQAYERAQSTLSATDYEIVTNNFVKRKLYSALVGREEYAKCFITSEYMFNIFNGGGEFEFTTIVCGYLKAIEQLAKKLLDATMTNYPNKELWILKNNMNPRNREDTRPNPALLYKKYPPIQVRVSRQNKRCFNETLAPLMWFLHDNADGWNVSNDAREIIHGYFENYTSECRNEHFHKDNIYNWDAVKKIRNNTILLMYLLIGGYKISDDEDESAKDIGAIDFRFDNLYRKLKEIPRGVDRFYIQFAGKEKQKVIRLFEQSKTEYSEGGFLDKAHMDFAIVQDFHIDNYEEFEQNIKLEDRLVISVDNIPEKMWFVKYGGEEVEIEW